MEDAFIIIIIFLSLSLIIQLLTVIKLYQIQMTQEELKTALDLANAKVDKIKTEIQALKDAIVNAGNVSPEVEAAANQLFTNLQTADDMNPDV